MTANDNKVMENLDGNVVIFCVCVGVCVWKN